MKEKPMLALTDVSEQ